MDDFGFTDKGKRFMQIESLKRYRDALSNYIDAAEEMEKIEEEINKHRTNPYSKTDGDSIMESIDLTNKFIKCFNKMNAASELMSTISSTALDFLF